MSSNLRKSNAADVRPSITKYVQQYPQLASEIREIFPMIAAMENLKGAREEKPDCKITMGPSRPERLGDFKIISEIGRGGMGIVYQAEQESLLRKVAVKVLPRQLLVDQKYLQRFRREAQIAASLHHTNIVPIFGVGEQDELHYYVMQFIEGLGLDHIVSLLNQKKKQTQQTRLPQTNKLEKKILQRLGSTQRQKYYREIAHLGRQASQALHYAHRRNILHRDIKPANLLMDQEGTVWIADFGLAKADQSPRVTRTGEVTGTLRYMAPEQFQGHNDCKSDIYSLGLTLYELVTLRPAFDANNQDELVLKIKQADLLNPRELNPSIPIDLESIILKAIALHPQQRYTSAESLAGDLQSFLQNRPITARKTTPWEHIKLWLRRTPLTAILAGICFILLIMIAITASPKYRQAETKAQEHKNPQANAELALKTMERIFERFGPRRTVAAPSLTKGKSHQIQAQIPNGPPLSKDTTDVLKELLQFYEHLARQTTIATRQTAQANQRMGDIQQQLGRHQAAIQAYQRSIRIYSRLEKNTAHLIQLARLYNSLGHLYHTTQNPKQSRQSHQESLKILQTLPQTPATIYEKANAYYCLAQSDKQLTQAIHLLEDLISRKPDDPSYPGHAHLLALCYREQYNNIVRRQPQQAEQQLYKAIKILKFLVQNFSVADYRYDLAETYSRFDIRYRISDLKVYHDLFTQALTILEKLVRQFPDIPQYSLSLAHLYHKLGSISHEMRLHIQAREYFIKSAHITGALLKKFPDNPVYQTWHDTFSRYLPPDEKNK